ncbi:MAG: class I SAM-dependent rRNA methyltransferase, partial [Pirellula staleyi]
MQKTDVDGLMGLVPPTNSEMGVVHISRPMLHPNIYRKRILEVEGNPVAGQWVAVYHQQLPRESNRRDNGSRDGDSRDSNSRDSGSRQGGFVDRRESAYGPSSSSSTHSSSREPRGTPQLFAYGIYNPKSEVAVRLYSWWGQWPDDAFWESKIRDAVSLRRDILKLDKTTDAYRVLHGESDGTPGLVVDRYGDCLSAEVFSLGMYKRCEPILAMLAKELGTKHTLIQECPQFISQEGCSVANQSSAELPSSVVIQENGVKYRVHFGTGHKTGFFCDQRDNRHRLAQLCEGKSVLDLCCYTGGFSVQAAKAGNASDVTGVDLDAEPLATAKKNADINQTRVRFVQSDAFAFMRDMLRIGRQYDVVVLDPPKLIRSRLELEEGSHKHFDLNRLAIQLVKPGGLLLTCSCAGLLDDESFHGIVRSAAKATGFDDSGSPLPPRTLQILHSHGAAP